MNHPPYPSLGPGPGTNLDLYISKQDEAGELIAKAKLTLTSLEGYDLSGVVVTQNGEPVAFEVSEDKTSISFDTVDTAQSVISGLDAGRYELKETVTPEKYLRADAITFTLMNNGDADCGAGLVIVSGSPVVMVDKADPSYKQGGNNSSRDPKSIPATGEESSLSVLTGLAVLILAAVCITGLGVFRFKNKE